MRSKLLTTLFSLSVAIAFVSSAHARTIDDDGVTLPADYCWGKPPTIECQGGVCNGTQGADVMVGTPASMRSMHAVEMTMCVGATGTTRSTVISAATAFLATAARMHPAL